MMRYGRSLRVTLFGASHAPAVGAVIEGVPRGTPIDVERVQADLRRRSPVGRRLSTRRREPDDLVVDRGIRAGRATGGSIRIHVANVDARPSDYRELRRTPRPGHADYPALVRYGPRADLAGGGIFSGRMTVGLVAAGAIAKDLLDARGIDVFAFTRSIGGIRAPDPADRPIAALRALRDAHEVGAIDGWSARAMASEIARARRSGDSVGGVVEARATGLPVGVGEPFFGSIESELAHLLFSIPGVKGVEFGDGFGLAGQRGSAANDPFAWGPEGRVVPTTNHAGGILGGLSTGAPLVVRAAVKPTSSIARPQATVDLIRHTSTTLVVKGRHDPCIVPRAVVVVEAVVAFGLADLLRTGGFLP